MSAKAVPGKLLASSLLEHGDRLENFAAFLNRKHSIVRRGRNFISDSYYHYIRLRVPGWKIKALHASDSRNAYTDSALETLKRLHESMANQFNF